MTCSMHLKLTANTLERHQLLSYKKQSIALHSKSMDWFLDSGNNVVLPSLLLTLNTFNSF